MKQNLQYAYSISILFGVLVTAYMMMSHEDHSRLPLRGIGSGVGAPAQAVVDPAVSQLLEVKNALGTFTTETSTDPTTDTAKDSILIIDPN